MRHAVLANITVLAAPAVAAALHAIDPGLYYTASQEDGLLEWATFWAFALAAGLFVRNAVADRRRRGGLPWFAIGLALFCAIVALEEISWGQRLLGYQPPAYFLEQNYQQELNLHNVVGTDLRMLAMQAILLGYGVLLAGTAWITPVGARLIRLRVVTPPPALIPSFAVLAAMYAWYPLDYTGEWVECATGMGFLFIATLTGPQDSADFARPVLPAAAALAAAAVTIAGLKPLTAADTDRRAAARLEVAALARDFESPKLHTRCGIHKRLYTFVREYGQTYVLEGEFAALVRDRGDPGRADYLLDPWQSPYWLRHKCDDGQSATFVYSFGPNRRRDSTEWEIREDDIGAFFSKRR